jgi:putative hydrolase of HD superfamily
MHLIERLKTTKREGWRRFGINHGESISDHMYRMSIITLICPPSLSSRLDIAKCTKMALIHDMAESLVGDITPVEGVTKAEKSRRETATMDYLCSGLLGNVDGGAQGRHIREIWQEYEDGETLESKFVHDVDKMELLLQMMEYERSHQARIDLGEFSHVVTRITLPEVQTWAEELIAERKEFWTSHGKQPPGVSESEEVKMQLEEYYGRGTNGVATDGANGTV